MRLIMAVITLAIAYSVPAAATGQQVTNSEPSTQLSSAQSSLAPSSSGRGCSDFEGSDNFRLSEPGVIAEETTRDHTGPDRLTETAKKREPSTLLGSHTTSVYSL